MSEKLKPTPPLTPQEELHRAQVINEIDYLFKDWQKETEKKQDYPVTANQKLSYFRELFIEAIWRKWPL